MAAYSQQEIAAPKKEMKLVGAFWRNDLKLAASNGMEGAFPVFMRKSEDFPENFSIGLMYQPKDERGEIVLLRCNGQHGVYNGQSGDSSHPHWDYHVHEASEKALEAGENPVKYASKTTAYASFEEALQYFVKRVNLNSNDAEKHFPDKTRQGELPF